MWALPEILRSSQEMPWASSMSISPSRISGSTMQPLPITGVTPSYMTPDGTWCRASLCPPAMTVWPALAPPA